MMTELKELVWRANLDLARSGLVLLTFGNVSGIDRRRGIIAIKPSGVPYEELKPEDIVLVDIEGRVVEGALNPSSDTPTHTKLYAAFADIGGIAHTHSPYATMFAQSRREIPCFGTTHADLLHGPVPVTRQMTEAEVGRDYEANTGKVIVERFAELSPLVIPAVLVASHGPFAWGQSPGEAVRVNIILEHIAKAAFGTMIINPGQAPLEDYLLEKHFQRKHGPQATYGQKKGEPR
ncbi:MAG: L-ribulose-5-phosphate 4-epimerase AraD [Candidatus Aminicenantales bacterium]